MEKDKNQIFKDLLLKKLKDRKKLKGYCFSYNSNSPIFNHSLIQKILYNTYYDVSKKIMKENKLKFAMKDYKDLKLNINSFEQKYKNIHHKALKDKNFSYDKINYTNLNEIFKEFLRDKNKHNYNKNSIIKSKLKLDNINRNIRKNRIYSILEKSSLNSNKIKTRIDTGQNKKNINENSYKKLIKIINQSRKKLQMNNNSRKKIKFFDINEIDNIDKFKNQKFIIKTNSNYNIRKEINDKEELKIKKQKYIDLYNNLDDDNENENENKNKNYNLKQNVNDKVNNNNKGSKNKINIKTKQRPLSYSRNNPKFINLNLYNNISSTDRNIINKRLFKSAFKRESSKIKNKPLYTTKIEDIINEYFRIKKNSKLQRIKYKEAHFLTYREIDNIMDIKEDLLIFSLKEKYLKKQFPKPVVARQNKRDLFIKKFKDDIDFMDNKDVKNYNLMNNTK